MKTNLEYERDHRKQGSACGDREGKCHGNCAHYENRRNQQKSVGKVCVHACIAARIALGPDDQIEKGQKQEREAEAGESYSIVVGRFDIFCGHCELDNYQRDARDRY